MCDLRRGAALLLLWAASPVSLLRAEPAETEILSTVREAYAAVETVRGTFTQTNDWGLLAEEETYRGSLYVRTDGRLRIEYTEPEGHLLVSDGASLWTYVPESGQAVRSSSATTGDALRRLFLDFLAGQRLVRVEVDGNEATLFLEPEDELALKELAVRVDRRTGLGLEYRWTDQEGNTARYVMTSMETNAHLDDSLFEFTPPSGVDVVVLDEPVGG